MFKPETHHRPPSTNPLVRQLRTQGNAPSAYGFSACRLGETRTIIEAAAWKDTQVTGNARLTVWQAGSTPALHDGTVTSMEPVSSPARFNDGDDNKRVRRPCLFRHQERVGGSWPCAQPVRARHQFPVAGVAEGIDNPQQVEALHQLIARMPAQGVTGRAETAPAEW